jgi:hypothetical protein
VTNSKWDDTNFYRYCNPLLSCDDHFDWRVQLELVKFKTDVDDKKAISFVGLLLLLRSVIELHAYHWHWSWAPVRPSDSDFRQVLWGWKWSTHRRNPSCISSTFLIFPDHYPSPMYNSRLFFSQAYTKTLIVLSVTFQHKYFEINTKICDNSLEA